jgi:hypothetical protein
MGIDWGGCLHSRAGVRPGKLVRKPFSRAIARVDRAGENRAAWAKATKSAGIADPIAACAVWAGGGVGALVGRDSQVPQFGSGVMLSSQENAVGQGNDDLFSGKLNGAPSITKLAH